MVELDFLYVKGHMNSREASGHIALTTSDLLCVATAAPFNIFGNKIVQTSKDKGGWFIAIDQYSAVLHKQQQHSFLCLLRRTACKGLS